MKRFVLDASVAIKWILPEDQEPFSEEAKLLLEQGARGEIRFSVPDIFWAEISNVIWKSLRRGKLNGAEALEAMKDLMALEVQVAQTREFLPSAFETAIESKIAVYDACYVELANRLDVPLVTADQSLYLKTAATLPVVWIGAIH